MIKNRRQEIVSFEAPPILLIKHIMIPFDDSDYSRTAFEFALDLARRYNAKISVVSIMYSSVMGSSFLDRTEHQTTIEKTRLRKLKSSFEDFKLRTEKFKVPFFSDIIVANSVSEAILAFASSKKVDLIIMGTRGRMGSPRHMRLGSVAIDVSQSSLCPVLFVK